MPLKVVHTYDLSTGEAEAGWCLSSKDSLLCIASLGEQ